MTLKEINEAIRTNLPAECFVVVEHTYRNYAAGDDDKWGCQVYENNNSPLESMFMVHRADSATELIEIAAKEYATYQANKPSVAAKIAELKNKLAKLEQRQEASNAM